MSERPSVLKEGSGRDFSQEGALKLSLWRMNRSLEVAEGREERTFQVDRHSVAEGPESRRGGSYGGLPRIVIVPVSSLLQEEGTRWGGRCFWCPLRRKPGRHHGVLPRRSQSCSPTYAVFPGKRILSYLDRLHPHPSAGCVMERPQVLPSIILSEPATG